MPVSAAVILCVNVWCLKYSAHTAKCRCRYVIEANIGFVCIMWPQMVISVAAVLFQRSPRLLLRLRFSEAHLILRLQM